MDGYLFGIPEMDMRGNKLVGDILFKEGLLEEITSFAIYYMDVGLVSNSCECVKAFWEPYFYACAWSG